MAQTMRAARYYGKEDVRIENTPRPVLSPGQILIKPSHVGICGTDLHEYIAGPTYVTFLSPSLFDLEKHLLIHITDLRPLSRTQ